MVHFQSVPEVENLSFKLLDFGHTRVDFFFKIGIFYFKFCELFFLLDENIIISSIFTSDFEFPSKEAVYLGSKFINDLPSFILLAGGYIVLELLNDSIKLGE